jgi:AcrR family transcriptional regulator
MYLNIEKSVREKILDAALNEFAAYGYALASTNRIHRDAMVSKGAIFKAFGSKSELFYCVFERSISHMLEALNEANIDGYQDVFEKIMAIVMWKISYTNANPKATRVMLEAISKPPKDVQNKVAMHLNDLTKLWINQFLYDIPMENIHPDFSREVVLRFIEIALAGIQSYYIKEQMTMEYMDSIRDESIRFLQTLLKGMEKK